MNISHLWIMAKASRLLTGSEPKRLEKRFAKSRIEAKSSEFGSMQFPSDER